MKSELVYLEKLKQSDLALYQQIYTDKKLMAFVGEVISKATAKKFFDQTLDYMSKQQPIMILYVTRENNTNTRIGVVGLRWNQQTTDSVEIGVIVKSSEQRKGYGHDAKQCLIKYAFKYFHVKSIIANCDEVNTAANLANKKLGFSKIETFVAKKRNCLTIKWQINKESMV